ncbi:MAG: DUF2680 domain-containing protein [Bacillota bacterium]|nr:DUF2680 domain-containing protein [Bacillota bacterium]
MKKTAAVVAVALVLALLAVPALAAGADVTKKLQELYKKELELRKEWVQLQVEAGNITQNQAQWLLDQLNLRQKYVEQGNFTAPGYGFGFGPGFRGRMGGFGWGGFGCPMHGGVGFFGPTI